MSIEFAPIGKMENFFIQKTENQYKNTKPKADLSLDSLGLNDRERRYLTGKVKEDFCSCIPKFNQKSLNPHSSTNISIYMF